MCMPMMWTSSSVLFSCGSSLQSVSFSLPIFLLSIMLSWVEGLEQDHQYFVYPQAPQRLVAPARRLGKLEHLNYIRLVKNSKSDNERLKLYTQHFSQCSSISGVAAPSLQEATTIGDLIEAEAKKFSRSLTPVQRLMDGIGLDSISSEFFNLTTNDLRQNIQTACLKNELQFQCAYGFLNDLDIIEEHIELMKKNDGIFKVMAERECMLADQVQFTDSSVFSCINNHAAALLHRCQKSISVYNATRLEVNSEMHSTFVTTVSAIEEKVQAAFSNKNSETLESLIKEGDTLIRSTLSEMLRIEAFKCRQYTQMERCLLSAVSDVCAEPDRPHSLMVVDSLATILRVGYLQRERGDTLHQQFLEAGILPHRACQVFA